jgi:hypothetical protein
MKHLKHSYIQNEFCIRTGQKAEFVKAEEESHNPHSSHHSIKISSGPNNSKSINKRRLEVKLHAFQTSATWS